VDLGKALDLVDSTVTQAILERRISSRPMPLLVVHAKHAGSQPPTAASRHPANPSVLKGTTTSMDRSWTTVGRSSLRLELVGVELATAGACRDGAYHG
jgi:hypothetical protein